MDLRFYVCRYVDVSLLRPVFAAIDDDVRVIRMDSSIYWME